MEKWKDIDDFPGYQVSNQGRVRSFYKANGYGGGFTCSKTNEPKILSLNKIKSGHLRVFLYKNKKRIAILIHRLVAIAFIPNPNNYTVVRHIDDNPSNNFVDNLKWGTQRDNVHDCINNKGMNYDGFKKYNNDRKTPIRAINKYTNEEQLFESQSEASRILNISQGNIWRSLKNNRASCGYYFEYIDEEECEYERY